MEPASKVSVPFTVVRRMRSSVPPRVVAPLDIIKRLPFESYPMNVYVQVLLANNVNTKVPYIVDALTADVFSKTPLVPDAVPEVPATMTPYVVL